MDQIIPIPDTIDETVRQYLMLRNKIKSAEEQFDARLERARQHLQTLNGALLEKLNDIGGQSVKTEYGTVYRSTKRSATIADGDTFRKFVREHEMFDLVDWKANANAVDDFIKENHAPPPGVNFSQTFTVGVRSK